MRKIAVLSVMCMAAAVGTAQAKPPTTHPTHPTHPAHPSNPTKPGYPIKPCTAHNAGYNASGKLVSGSLTATTKGHYTGTLIVNVTKANHGSAEGPAMTFTLTNIRVILHHGTSASALAAGSRVGLHGKITEIPNDCTANGFTPTITVTKVDIWAPKAPKP